MSEGTMQRRAQRDGQYEQRVRRTKRLRRALVGAAAVPVILVAAGCSSDSGSDSGSASGSGDSTQQGSGGANPSASASPTIQAAAFQKLPKACGVLSTKTLTELVPKGVKSAKEGTSDDATSRASCSWSSLENKGVKGSQFRWLNVSLLRFDSDAARGSGEKQAQTFYAKQVQDARAVPEAKNAASQPLAGTGDEATTVRYDLKKKEGAFKQQTVVARVANVVVTLDYNGAGLAGEKTPNADDLVKAAQQAAKEATTAVASANGVDTGSGSGGTAGGAGTTSPSPSKSASKSASPSSSPSKAASASPSTSASKKS
ncbi:DUF3558 domain-containing protein [Streptomyces adustus]|uniref:DUF3558 domain-containing protein n=1 Tax=Streptomyces adustus TaxID=1609272 RepID=A0A5N8VT88_9ACTN|nr:DUF3558 domain-containing protein [Streptomyces adustus]MPY37384.1 DUF3558 domain-containing protein [Streptomyces adustus]